MPAAGPTGSRGLRPQDFWLANLGAADAYTRWILDEVKPWLGHRILEVGCGTGTFTAPLAAAGHALVAVDIDPEYVEATARRTSDFPAVSVRRADVNHIDSALGDGFDSVVMFDVLEHIENDVALLESLFHRLRPGGHVVLKVPAINARHSPMDDAVGHWRRYDRAALTSVLSRSGFELAKLWRFNAFAVPGWWLNGRVLKRATPPAEQVKLFNKLIPLLRPLDYVFRHVTGLSYFAVGRRP